MLQTLQKTATSENSGSYTVRLRVKESGYESDTFEGVVYDEYENEYPVTGSYDARCRGNYLDIIEISVHGAEEIEDADLLEQVGELLKFQDSRIKHIECSTIERI